jgi:hypothetical protein
MNPRPNRPRVYRSYCPVPSVEEKKEEVMIEEKGEEHAVQAVSAQKLTSPAALNFHVANVKTALASAVAVVKAGNRIVLDVASDGSDRSFIENKETGERMTVKVGDSNTFVFDVQYENGESGLITLDSGAAVSVWPKALQPEVPLRPKKTGIRMIAANGTEIVNLGQKVIKFRGIKGLGFTRQV